jgi:Zn-dependent protease with chaperone function
MAVGRFLRALILFAFVLFLLLFLIISKRQLGIKIRFGLFGMVLGISFAIYSLLPVLTVWISSCFQDIAKLSSIPNLKAAIAEHNATGVLWFSTIPIILLYAIVVFIAWIFLHDGISMADKLVSMAKSKSTDSRSGLQLAFEKNPSSKIFSAFIFAIWIFCALSNVFGFYFSSAGLEYGFTGNNLLLGSNMFEIVKNNFRIFFSFISILGRRAVPVESILRALFLIYAIPLAAIFLVLIVRWIAELRRIALWRRANPAGEIKDIIDKICSSLGIRHPVLAISDEPVITGSIKSIFPIGIVLKVSKNTIEMLGRDELTAMIAHEMSHLKKHSLIYSFLDFLSEWTFFGKGFLAIITNSKETEFEADRFACKWLESNGYDKMVLISALQKSVVASAMLGYLAPSDSIMAFSGREITEPGNNISFAKRMRLCYELYFGDLVLSYIHPSIEERIKRIEGL